MQILPFKGVLFNQEKVDIKDVVTLPYDKISKNQKSIYQNKNEHNMVHLILPKAHKEASCLLKKWLNEGVLKEDSRPAIYLYEQEYEFPKGVTNVRKSIIAILNVQPFSKDTVMPHEKTFSKIVSERMDLLEQAQANLEQIFLISNDVGIDKLTSDNILIDFTDEFNIKHKLSAVYDSAVIENIQKRMDKSRLFIADGHHRYTAALNYKTKKKDEAGSNYTGSETFNYRLATFVDIESEGLTILPTHRVLKNVNNFNKEEFISKLKEYFDVKEGKVINSNTPNTLGIYFSDNTYYTVILKKDISLEKILNISGSSTLQHLDVNILHLLIFKHIMGIDTSGAKDEADIMFIREEEEAVRAVKNKEAQIAFILNPTKIEEVKQIVSLGEVMPHKSTDFYPKLHSGLVMRAL